MGRHGKEVGGRQMGQREGQADDERDEEHPLHQRDGAVATYQGAAGAQIEGKDGAVGDAKDDAQWLCGFGTTAHGRTLQYEPHDAAKADGDAEHFLPGDRLLEEEGGKEHREYGRDGGDDGEVDGCGSRNGVKERQLRQEDAYDAGGEYLEQVAWRHFFARSEERGQPEEQACNEGADGEEHYGRQTAVGGDVAAEDDVDAKDGVGGSTGQVSQGNVFVRFHL